MPAIVPAYGKNIYLSDNDISDLNGDELAMQMYAEYCVERKRSRLGEP